jgi:hypothetical protein
MNCFRQLEAYPNDALAQTVEYCLALDREDFSVSELMLEFLIRTGVADVNLVIKAVVGREGLGYQRSSCRPSPGL